jgi:hypothetical protein
MVEAHFLAHLVKQFRLLLLTFHFHNQKFNFKLMKAVYLRAVEDNLTCFGPNTALSGQIDLIINGWAVATVQGQEYFQPQISQMTQIGIFFICAIGAICGLVKCVRVWPVARCAFFGRPEFL